MTGATAALQRPQRRSRILRDLRQAVYADLEPQVTLVERVAVLAAAGYRKGEIAERVDADPAQLRNAWATLKRVAPQLEVND